MRDEAQSQDGGLTLLDRAFKGVLAFRFLYPFFRNPVAVLSSDMQRHWENGANLFNPSYLASVDPKVYQVWIYLLRRVAHESLDGYGVIAFFTGLLCAAMPWFWYRALREICPKRGALQLAILIGLYPATLCIYGYFMNETAALTFGALAMWTTLRALRKQTQISGVLAVFCWLLAGFAKQTMLPAMCIALGYLFLRQKKKLPFAVWAAVLFLLFAIPAGLHTMKGAYIFAPFGDDTRSLIDHDSHYTIFRLVTYDAEGREDVYHWSSPSFYVNPFDPFGQYVSPRTVGTYLAAPVRISEGRAGWSEALATVAAGHSFSDGLQDLKENFIYLFFGPEWPDSNVSSADFLSWFDFQARWIWPPCLGVLLLLGPFARLTRERMLIAFIGWSMTVLFLFQQTGVMEGRYRKPLEPFFLCGAAFILASFHEKDRSRTVTARAFLSEIFSSIQAFLKEARLTLSPSGKSG